MTRGAAQSTFMINQVVGEWKLLEYSPAYYSDKGRKLDRPAMWRCVCSCGTIRWVRSANLQNGSSTSCGHAAKGNKFKHLDVQPVNSVFGMANGAPNASSDDTSGSSGR